MPEQTFIVPEDSTPDRADKILAAHYPEVSRAAIQRFIESGKVRRKNGDKLEPKKKLHPGEVLLVDLSPEPIPGLRPVDLPIGILYEDESLVVVDKPSGMVVHPGDGTGEDTLVHALLHHCNEKLSTVGAPERPGIVHRLDKDTSGVNRGRQDRPRSPCSGEAVCRTGDREGVLGLGFQGFLAKNQEASLCPLVDIPPFA